MIFRILGSYHTISKTTLPVQQNSSACNISALSLLFPYFSFLFSRHILLCLTIRAHSVKVLPKSIHKSFLHLCMMFLFICRFSWIHLDDIVNLIYEALLNPSYKGIFLSTKEGFSKDCNSCKFLMLNSFLH